MDLYRKEFDTCIVLISFILPILDDGSKAWGTTSSAYIEGLSTLGHKLHMLSYKPTL